MLATSKQLASAPLTLLHWVCGFIMTDTGCDDVPGILHTDSCPSVQFKVRILTDAVRSYMQSWHVKNVMNIKMNIILLNLIQNPTLNFKGHFSRNWKNATITASVITSPNKFAAYQLSGNGLWSGIFFKTRKTPLWWCFGCCWKQKQQLKANVSKCSCLCRFPPLLLLSVSKGTQKL